MAYKSSARGTAPVIWITGHTAEGARTKESLGAYFYRDDVAASSHVGIDCLGTAQYVDYSRAAWTLRAGNPISDNAEMCGFARWTTAQWMSTATIDGCVNPLGMVNNFAAWVRARCIARLIPIRKIWSADVAARRPGIIGHLDYTDGTGDGSHWDPGTGFPWQYVIDRANGGNVSDVEVNEIRAMMWKGGPVPGSIAPGTLIDVAREIRSMLWAGGNVEGSVVDGTLISDVREMKAVLDQVLARLDEMNSETI